MTKTDRQKARETAKAVRRAHGALIRDAAERRAAVVPSGKRYRRKAKHRRQENL